ncbi:STAS domain-containing protein [Streptomyces sp. BBFR2]|uniref:STAS domain-containing protein n=1 Tax=Streptomyces sp. BBFR2 TaxID=3372854 RepID=UPI0037DA327E
MTATPVTTAPVTAAGEAVVALDGELDVLTAPGAAVRLAAAAAHHDRLHVDLRRVTFMDTTGLAPLTRTARTLRGRGGGVTLTLAAPCLLRLLRLTGAAPLFDRIDAPAAP